MRILFILFALTFSLNAAADIVVDGSEIVEVSEDFWAKIAKERVERAEMARKANDIEYNKSKESK